MSVKNHSHTGSVSRVLIHSYGHKRIRVEMTASGHLKCMTFLYRYSEILWKQHQIRFGPDVMDGWACWTQKSSAKPKARSKYKEAKYSINRSRGGNCPSPWRKRPVIKHCASVTRLSAFLSNNANPAFSFLPFCTRFFYLQWHSIYIMKTKNLFPSHLQPVKNFETLMLYSV